MLRKVGITISYFIAIVYIVSIVLPGLYCLRQGCKGPGELDAFMPAFMLTPLAAIATAFSLQNAIQQIRKRQAWSWIFWPLAAIFERCLPVKEGTRSSITFRRARCAWASTFGRDDISKILLLECRCMQADRKRPPHTIFFSGWGLLFIEGAGDYGG